MARVDLNADLGEGAGDDEAMLALVTSANVACGFHAGDAATMRATCAAARATGVVIGAHVGYRDREGFGRRETGAPAETIGAECAEQLAALADAAGTDVVRYVKPHGALYTRCASDRAAADAVVGAALGAGLGVVLGPPGSALLDGAEAAGLEAIAEGFADRRYVVTGGRAALLGREHDGALLAAQVAVAPDGSEIAVAARSICLHGDTPGAAGIASAVRAALEEAGVAIEPFA